MSSTLKVGDQVEVLIGPIANGGHFVARHNGQVIFVRHAITGETALVEITSISSKLARADAISIIKASPDRIESICKFSGPGKCGGCDFQHLNLPFQRKLKADVIKEQFSRIAKMDIDVTVHEVAPTTHYRTHIRGVANEAGQFGIYASRSHDIIPISDCLIAGEELHVEKIATEKLEPMEPIEVPQGDLQRSVLGKK